MENIFEPTTVIDPGLTTVPKTGHIGYVKVENYHYEGPELEPKWIDVDVREFEDIR